MKQGEESTLPSLPSPAFYKIAVTPPALWSTYCVSGTIYFKHQPEASIIITPFTNRETEAWGGKVTALSLHK